MEETREEQEERECALVLLRRQLRDSLEIDSMKQMDEDIAGWYRSQGMEEPK